MKQITIFTVLLILPLFSFSQTENGNCPVQINYPQWFFSTPPSNATVGFDLQSKPGQEDAYDRLCGYEKMRAKGVLNFFDVNGQIEHTSEELYFYYDPNNTGIAQSELTAIDSFNVTNAHKIYLYAHNDLPTDINNSEITLCEAPRWSSANEIPGRIYGEGIIGLSYYDHVGSWVRSESDAIRDLLNKSAVSVASVLSSSNNYEITEVLRYEYDLEVTDIQIERRWVDFDDWSCHVIVSAPASGISEWVADSSSSLSDSSIAALSEDPTSDVVVEPNTKYNTTISDSTSESNRPQKESNSTRFEVGSYEWNSQYYRARKGELQEQRQSKSPRGH